MKKQAVSLALVTAFGMAGVAYAQGTTTGQAPMKPSATAADRKIDSDTKEFFEEAAVGGLAEVQLSQIAVDKATDPEVKKFAQMMVDDHTKSNQEMTQLAKQMGVSPPTQLEAKHKRMETKLSKVSGAPFDRMYIEGQIDDHEDMIDLHEKQAKKGKVAEVKQHAEKMLPSLREHLKQAEQIQSNLKKNAKGAS